MSVPVLSFLGFLQPLFAPASVLWLILSKHIPRKMEDEHYFQLTYSILPGVLLHYLGVVLKIVLSHYEPNTFSKAYYILLCLDTLLLFDVISHIIQRRKYQHEKAENEVSNRMPESHDDDSCSV